MADDPQFGIIFVLRPYPGFEAIYQGQPASGAAAVPLMLSEAGLELDAQAGTPGYDPSLVRGLPIPQGAKVVLWVPDVVATVLGLGASQYNYWIIWRARNTADYRRTRAPYHFPKQIEGVPETGVDPGPRVIIPAAMQSIVYNQPEVAAGAVQTQQAHAERIAFGGPTMELPLNSDGLRGVIQQGVQTTAALNRHTRPSWVEHKLVDDARGDELLIAVTRNDIGGAHPNWELGAGEADAAFAGFYGSVFADLGLQVIVGK